MSDLRIIHELPATYCSADVDPVLYVDQSRAMFALLITQNPGGEDEVRQPIAMSYVDAVALGEAIMETVEGATAGYFSPVPLRKSTNIKEALYHTGRSVLRVTFKGGSCYDYFGIPGHVIDTWKSAPSVGKFFNSAIAGKPEVYPFRQLDEKE